VVVTGMGTLTPYGLGVETLWENLVAGRSAIGWLRNVEEEFPVRFGGQLPELDYAALLPDLNDAKFDPCALAALVAARQALEDAGLGASERAGAATIVGSGYGASISQGRAYAKYAELGWRRTSPDTILKGMFNTLSSSISVHCGLGGPNHVLASACASGAAALGQAFHLIRHGVERRALAGGVDVYITPPMLSAWTNMRVLSRNPVPAAASRPFDKRRDGLVLSEGASLVVLEELGAARERGARVLAEVTGYGSSSDATHLAIPSAAGQAAALRRALESAGIGPGEVDYINAHGTSTQRNDATETEAIKEVLGGRARAVPVSSIKSMLGHSMGASGATELVATVMTIGSGVIPPTINYEYPDAECDLDYTPNAARRAAVRVAVSNSFGFGGNNAVLVLKRYEG